MTVVQTRGGAVRGVDAGGATAWRGIPYARPPVGPLRWKPPQAPEPWSGVRDGSRFPARAMQLPLPAAFAFPPDPDVAADDPSVMSEDCLYINVCAPDGAAADGPSPGGGWPVLVWIHGGGFHFGAGPMLVGDGVPFTRRGIVVVTFNYRLGALGFLHLADLLGPDYATSGNCGLADQVAALTWVRDNIAAFGGDPGRVTIAGCSAGGKSVSALMAAPAARGLFARAVSESGGQHVASAEMATGQTRRLLAEMDLGPDGAATLVGLPADEVLASQRIFGAEARATWIWRPTVDGAFLPRAPLDAVAAGSAAGIPLLAGVTGSEAASYDVADPTAAEQTPRILEEIFGADARRVLDVYAANRPGASERDLCRAAMSDERYGIPTLRLLDAQASHGPTWRYRFDAQGHVPAELRAGHGTEVSFVFALGLAQLDPARRAVAEAMHEAWAAFVAGRPPDAAGLPDWPGYDPDRRATMILDTPPRVVDDPEAAERRVWEGVALPETPWWPLLSRLEAQR